MFGIGTPELIFIFLIGFFIFGPRQLPEIGRRLGEIMAQLRRAADDFKQTWEAEVESERNRITNDLSSVSIELEPTSPNLPEPDVQPVEGAFARTPRRLIDEASEPPLSLTPPTETVEAVGVESTSCSPVSDTILPASLPTESLPPMQPVAPSVEFVGYEG